MDLEIRRIAAQDYEAACAFVWREFMRETSARMTDAGVAVFRDYVRPDAMRARDAAGATTLIALERGEIIGLLRVRQSHVSLFFVAAPCRRRGIGRGLFEIVDERCPPQSVHSSVDAVGAYERLGFRGAGPEQMRDGLRFVPMERRASHSARSPSSASRAKLAPGGGQNGIG